MDSLPDPEPDPEPAPAQDEPTAGFTVYAGPPDDEAGAERLRKGNQALRDKGVEVTVIAWPGNTDAAYEACGGECLLPRWFGPGTNRPGQKNGVGLRWILNYVDSLPDPEPDPEPIPAPVQEDEPDEPETEVEVIEPEEPKKSPATAPPEDPTCDDEGAFQISCISNNGKNWTPYLAFAEKTLCQTYDRGTCFEVGNWLLKWNGWSPPGVEFTVTASVGNTNIVELKHKGSGATTDTETIPTTSYINRGEERLKGRCTDPQSNFLCKRYHFAAAAKGVGTVKIGHKVSWKGSLPAGWTVHGVRNPAGEGGGAVHEVDLGYATIHVKEGGYTAPDFIIYHAEALADYGDWREPVKRERLLAEATARLEEARALLDSAGYSYAQRGMLLALVNGSMAGCSDSTSPACKSAYPRIFYGDPTDDGWDPKPGTNNGDLAWLRTKVAALLEEEEEDEEDDDDE